MTRIRTDLALEARELYSHHKDDMMGVESESHNENGMEITRVRITSPEGERKLGKAMGNYITIEAAAIKDRNPEYYELVSQNLSNELKSLLNLHNKSNILVVGLGNWNITPDSLGPKVVDRIMVTRHILKLIPEQVDERVQAVCAIAPGVLGITGMETGEIVKGIVDRVRPDVVIVIDALASRKTQRIGTTIQIADTGINPGSGIGNKRMGISEETLGVKTIAIGVPMVVYAHTIGRDSLEILIKEFSNQATPGTEFYKMLGSMQEADLDAMVSKVLSQGMGDLVVTPKEVDMLIDDISGILSDGLNLALHHNISLEESRRFMH
ncbi:MAG: GPR endopeptidase [Clostridiales bacterium]|nr:GPR endopeptidase [Clostridiales bacterium]